MTILETVYKHEFLISTHSVCLNTDPEKGKFNVIKENDYKVFIGRHW